MNKAVLVLLLCLVKMAHAQSSLASYVDSFAILNTQVRDNKINKVKAKVLASVYLQKLKLRYMESRKAQTSVLWHFPLLGYDKNAIGGTNGNGYQPNGYNYLDGNKHLGHPAHDIFIQDSDQDVVDDKSRKEVEVRSISNGIVVALETKWESTSELRGGKYIWVYDPIAELLFYYAHNNTIYVRLGDVLQSGDIIATVGRTGKNAYKKRSPTHLHLMVLQTSGSNFLVPYNPYKKLLVAKTTLR